MLRCRVCEGEIKQIQHSVDGNGVVIKLFGCLKCHLVYWGNIADPLDQDYIYGNKTITMKD